MWRAAPSDAAERLRLPDIDERALPGLKFADALYQHLAVATRLDAAAAACAGLLHRLS